MLRAAKVPNSAEVQKQTTSYKIAVGAGSSRSTHRVAVESVPCRGCPDMVGNRGISSKEMKPFKPLTMAELQERRQQSNYQVAKII